MKKIATLLIILLSLNTFAQWTGTYNTKYGTVKLVTELGTKNNDFKRIIYGDYGNNGTMVGGLTGANTVKELSGKFHNGSNEGSYVWNSLDMERNPSSIKSFAGNWGYGNQNNKNSSNPDHNWNGNQNSGIMPTDLKNAVWSGVWNSNFGEVILEQIGMEVKGNYYNNGKVGRMEGTYNKTDQTLQGSYIENGRRGVFRFALNPDGNSFSGRWGWGAVMNEPSPWNGTKKLKTNAPIGNTQANSTLNNSINNQTNSTVQNTSNSNSQNTKLKVYLKNMTSNEKGVYGIWGVKLFRVTNNSRTLVNSFGNKNELIFNYNRDNSKLINSTNYTFSNTPENYREFIISTADLNNPNIKFELEVITHPKIKKTIGSDIDCGREKQIIVIDNEPNIVIKNITSYIYGFTKFGSGIVSFDYELTKTSN